jgi:hypothetical protein
MSKFKYLFITAVTILVTVAFSATAFAQQEHAVGVGKTCPEVSKVGDTATCTLRVSNEDEFGDTLSVTEMWDLVAGGTAWEFRNPAVGNLPIIQIDPDVVCTAAPISADAPLGWIFPCTIPGVVTAAGGGGSGKAVRVESMYTIPGDFVPLLPNNPQIPDQNNVIVRDVCDEEPIGCNFNDQGQQFGAAVSLFESSLEVTKTGPNTVKVGDEITYTIGFVDTSTSLAPALENCTGSDTLLGDLGAFVDGVNRNFNYVVQAGDPNPLPNTATITCDVVGFDNEASDDDSHSVVVIDPSIDVTKEGPDTAKVGDEITYTIGFTDTGTGTLGVCTGSDTLLGPLGVFVDGVTRDFLYIVQEVGRAALTETGAVHL